MVQYLIYNYIKNQSVANPTDLQYDQGEYKRNSDFVAYRLEIDKINYVNNDFEVVSACENHTSYFHFVMDNGSSRADFNGIYTF